MNSIGVRIYLNRLQRRCSAVKKTRIKTIGVYASDRIPGGRIAPSTAIVVNTKPHTHGGEHWVAFYRPTSSTVVEYFDSLGRPPYQHDFQELLRRSNDCTYVYNKYRLQGYDTKVCGHYCLVFLYCRIVLNIKSVNEFAQLFDISKRQQHQYVSATNDMIIRRLFNLLFTKSATTTTTTHRQSQKRKQQQQQKKKKDA